MNSDEVTAECEVAAKAMEELLLQRVSPKERIAASLGWVVSLGILFSQQVVLEPGPTFLCAVVTSAAAFCWDVYGRPMLRAASLHYD